MARKRKEKKGRERAVGMKIIITLEQSQSQQSTNMEEEKKLPRRKIRKQVEHEAFRARRHDSEIHCWNEIQEIRKRKKIEGGMQVR